MQKAKWPEHRKNQLRLIVNKTHDIFRDQELLSRRESFVEKALAILDSQGLVSLLFGEYCLTFRRVVDVNGTGRHTAKEIFCLIGESGSTSPEMNRWFVECGNAFGDLGFGFETRVAVRGIEKVLEVLSRQVNGSDNTPSLKP